MAPERRVAGDAEGSFTGDASRAFLVEETTGLASQVEANERFPVGEKLFDGGKIGFLVAPPGSDAGSEKSMEGNVLPRTGLLTVLSGEKTPS